MKRRIILVVGLVGLGLFFVFNVRSIVRMHHTRVAVRYQYITQAICDFRAQHGLLPESLQELVPTCLPALPASPSVLYFNGTLSIPTGLPNTQVSYSFHGGNEHWESEGDFGVGPLTLSQVTPSVTPIADDNLARARLGAYDRRIVAAPKELRHRAEKIGFLISLDRNVDALAECRIAALAHPDWWRAQMGLATLAPQVESSVAEMRFCIWVQEHPSFIHYWYLARYYRDRGQAKKAIEALRDGSKYPLENVDPDPVWVPDAFAFDAATFACKYREPELVLAIVDMWSKPRGIYDNMSPDLLPFRAAGKLALGRIKEARVDADIAIATSRERVIWAGNLDQLDSAIRQGDSSYVYDPGTTTKGLLKWSLFPEPK